MSLTNEVYNDCSVGIPYGDLDGKITASSELSPKHTVLGCKLGKGSPREGHAAAWCTKENDRNGWIQVEFPKPLTLSAVATQGREGTIQYVTRYRVLVSDDGRIFMHTWEFNGNTNNTEIVKNTFPRPVTARFARIQILDSIGYSSLRFDFYHIPTLDLTELLRYALRIN